METADLMLQLKQAGIRQLRFTSPNVAYDQLNRKVVFYRIRNNGHVKLTFRIS